MIRIICLTLLLAVSFGSSLQAVTRYVAKAGTSVSGAWVGHWTTISQVNSGTNPGDTVFFGSGIWRAVQLVVVGGSPGAPTVYACSSFATVNGSGEYHFARIYASNEVTGWTSIGGGIYSHSGSVSGPLFEGQTMLMKSSSTSLGQGQWWTGGGETRVRLTSDRTPASGTSIETSSGGAGTTVLLDSQDYVLIWGLDVRYGNNRNIAASYQSSATNFITIENCKVGPCAGNFSSNPGNIYSGTTSGMHNDWVIRACSLGATYALNGNSVVSMPARPAGAGPPRSATTTCSW